MREAPRLSVRGKLQAHGKYGRLPIGDKSLAEDVYRRVGMSKKVFKKALGALYKQGLVVLYPDETVLKS